jgi:pimeloyl-ACP methyl ester carboxylesterase
MSQILRRYADTPEGQIHYRERPGDGRVVLLVHQTPSSSLMWERVMAIWAPGPRLIAVDTPGFGQSDPPAELPAAGIAYYAARMAGFLDALGLDRVDVVGHHTGAMVAIELAASAPERVGRLVLIGTVLVTAQEGREYLEHTTRWAPDSAGAFVADGLVPAMRERVSTDDGGHFLDELVGQLQAGPRWWWIYEGVFGYDAFARAPLVRAPTLVAVGGDEAEYMLRWSAGTAELIPGAEYRVLEGAGVEVAYQDPQRTLELIDGFLADRTQTP